MKQICLILVCGLLAMGLPLGTQPGEIACVALGPVVLTPAAFAAGALAGAPLAHAKVQGGLRMFAAVFSVRGSIVGKTAGRFGAFIRQDRDTTWQMVSPSDVYSWGLGYFESGSTRRYYLAAGNGVQRSTDGGKSWRVLTGYHMMESLSILPDPVDSALLYAATPWGVFRTTDDGKSWTLTQDGMRRWFVQSLAMDRGDRRILYAAAEDDLYRSTDSGLRWTPLRAGVAHVHSILLTATRPERIIVCAEESGIRWSNDAGMTWRTGDGTAGIPLYALAGTPSGDTLYTGGWESGVLRSTDGGLSWITLKGGPAGMTILSIAVDPENPRHVASGADGEGIYETFDAGTSWSRAGLMGAKVKAIGFYP